MLAERSSAVLWAEWPAPSRVRACTTLRHGAGISRSPFDQFNLGDHVGDDPQAVRDNRAALKTLLHLPAEPQWLQQVHGVAVLDAEAIDSTRAQTPQADAAISRQVGTVLAVLTADCLPVLLVSHEGDEIAAVHAGWRGLLAGVIESTLQKMRTPADQVMAWIGPAIGPEAFEVGEEVRAAFVAEREVANAAFVPSGREGKWCCDLAALAEQRLRAARVENVYLSRRCTFSEPTEFYSYRREARGGRMASLIWMT